MLSTNPTHAALLDSLGPLVIVELLTFTLVGGTVLRYCSAAIPLTYGGYIYQPMSFEHNETVLTLGLEVQTLDISFYPKIYPVSCQVTAEEDQILGLPWIQAIHRGALNGASFSLDRGDIDPLAGPDIVGITNQFYGYIAASNLDDGLKLTVKDPREVLNRQIPAGLYQAGCAYNLFDQGCGLNAALWAEEDAAAAGSDERLINCGLTQPADYFALGNILFMSGANAGVRRAIRESAPGVLTLAAPLWFAPHPGDTFTAWPGCDGQKATCTGKFSNFGPDGLTLRFRGQPWIPEPERALA